MTIFDVTHGSIVTRTAELTGWTLAERVWEDDGQEIFLEVYTSDDSTVTVHYDGQDRLIYARNQEHGSDSFYAREDYNPASHDLLGLVTLWFHSQATI